MIYQEFLKFILDEVQGKMESGYELKLNVVLKNNGLKLDALTVQKEGSRLATNIDLNDYYNQYTEGRKVTSIVDEVVTRIKSHKDEIKDQIPDIKEFDTISKQITYRLINYEMNKDKLGEIPYKVIEDLAKVYYLVLKSDMEGVSSIAITNDMMKLWQVAIDDIDSIADRNTQEYFPATIKSMDDIVKEMLLNQVYELSDPKANQVEIEQLLQGIENSSKESTKPGMYVLTNKSNVNGAATILYEGMLHSFALKQQSNLYILPSSTHEVILIPDRVDISKEELLAMVIDVNRTQVLPEEVLSNSVYYYDIHMETFNRI